MKSRHGWLIFAVIIVAAVVRFFYLLQSHLIYWDAAVYMGMAKYLYTWGYSGLWEPIRPMVWPLLLGIPHSLGFGLELWGHILQLGFSIGILWLTYEIGSIAWGRRAGVIAASIMAFSAAFFFYSFRLITEIPAAFFAMLGLYLYLKGKPLLSGLAVGVAFMTKFPFGIFLLVIILADLKRPKKWLRYFGGFLIPVVPYLLLNYWWYGSFLWPLLEAKRVIGINVGCNILWAQPWTMYITQVPFDSIFMVLAVIGAWYAFWRWDMPNRLLLMGVGFPLIYLMQLSCRDYRFAMMYLPILSVLAGVGLVRLFRRPFERWSHIFPMLVFAIIGISMLNALVSYNVEEPVPWPNELVEYYSYTSEGEIIAASPWPAAYSDVRIRTLYYPNFDTLTAEAYSEYLSDNSRIGLVFWDECAGGVECGPTDLQCPAARDELISVLKNEFTEKLSVTHNQCRYVIYGP